MRLRRTGDRRAHVLGTLIALVFGVLGLAAVLARSFDWTWQPALVAAACAHYVLPSVFVAFGAALLARRWATALLTATLSAVVLVPALPAWVSDDIPPHGRRVVIMQANLKIGAAEPGPIVAQVKAAKVDVLTTEELTYGERQRLVSAGLLTLLPYRFSYPSADDGEGIAIWSRFPLSGTTHVGGFVLRSLRAQVAIPGAPVTVVAVHVQAPWPYPPHVWLRELGRLRGDLGDVRRDEPVLVGGDFNATIDHAQFRDLLTGGYADATGQAGAGYVPTYPADTWFPPVLGIDHVLTRRAVATDVYSVALPGSDHRGLIASVVLNTGD